MVRLNHMHVRRLVKGHKYIKTRVLCIILSIMEEPLHISEK